MDGGSPGPLVVAALGSSASTCAIRYKDGVKPAQLAQIAFIAIASFFVYAFVATAKDGETRRTCAPLCAVRPNYAADNRAAPDFELPSMFGGKKRLSDYRGQVVVLNFWTKTCKPCLEEMPSLAKLGLSLREREGMSLVTITTDESAEDARATLHSLLEGEPPFEVLIDPDGEIVTDKFGTKLFPETWFIDEEGIIRARVDGARDWSSAIAVDFADSLRERSVCGVEFVKGKPSGPFAGLCGELGQDG